MKDALILMFLLIHAPILTCTGTHPLKNKLVLQGALLRFNWDDDENGHLLAGYHLDVTASHGKTKCQVPCALIFLVVKFCE